MSRAASRATPRAVAEPAPRATLADLSAEVRRLEEQAALVDAAAEEVRHLFVAGREGDVPPRLLQRAGEGTRPAGFDTLAQVLSDLVTLSALYRDRARALLALSVEVPGGAPVVATAVGLGDDHAVEAPRGRS